MGALFDGYTPAFTTVFLAFAIWILMKPKQQKRKFKVPECQTIASATRKEGESAIYRNPITPFGQPLYVSHKKYEHITNMYEGFLNGLKFGEARSCLGKRTNNGPYVYESYGEIHDRIKAFGSGLIECGLEPKKQHYVGVYAKNCPEWVIAALACGAYSFIIVPLYDTLGHNAIKYIINQTGMTLVIVEEAKLDVLMGVAKECPTFKYAVKIGNLTQEEKNNALENNLTLFSFMGLQSLGKENLKQPQPSTMDDLITICYTSGTTGDPKGVMLTHRNLIADANAVFATIPDEFMLNENEVHLSFLPLAHIFEQMIMVAIISVGGRIAFYGGDVLKLLDDAVVAKPTIFPAVPRLLNRVYSKILSTVKEASPLRQWIFNLALSSKKNMIKKGVVTNDSFWDRLVFKKIQARLGGRVRLMVTGAAPIAADVLEFFRIAFGCEVLEGYGQTETSAACTISMMGDYNTEYDGHVGAVLPCNEIKLVDIPEMEYLSTDKPNPRGEVCVRGNNVFRGYYRMEEKTKETLDSDGWCHTGDVGMIMPNGTLKIIDRKKDLLKLSQGEYVALTKVENIYVKAPCVAQVYVHGNSLESALIGIIVPDPESFVKWAESHKLTTNLEELCKNEKAIEYIMSGLIAKGKEAKLHSFEQVKAIYLEPVAFSVENEMLTPSFKLKRHVISKAYKSVIDGLYKKINAKN